MTSKIITSFTNKDLVHTIARILSPQNKLSKEKKLPKIKVKIGDNNILITHLPNTIDKNQLDLIIKLLTPTGSFPCCVDYLLGVQRGTENLFLDIGFRDMHVNNIFVHERQLNGDVD